MISSQMDLNFMRTLVFLQLLSLNVEDCTRSASVRGLMNINMCRVERRLANLSEAVRSMLSFDILLDIISTDHLSLLNERLSNANVSQR